MLKPESLALGYSARVQFARLHARRQRWAAVVAHRRAGKTVACVADLIDATLRCKKPNPRFAYVAPFFSQAKDVAWNYLRQYTAPIPGVTANESELRIDLPGGGRVRLYGADNYQRLRGIYLDGVVLDEFGDMDPRAWQEVIRPSLSDRKGWAVFIGTPKGINHFAELYHAAEQDAEWMALKMPASETGLVSQEELDDNRKQMSDEQYAAEFECSFEASVVGSYWGKELAAAERDGRVTRVPYQEELSVDTWWDLGMDDATTIWCTQNVGREVHVIDYYEDSGGGLPAAARWLQEKPYIYGTHNAPFDIKNRELGTGKSRIETAATLGIRFQVVPELPLMDGINAARSFIARCWFDKKATEFGRQALTSYARKWDEKRRVFNTHPNHNWASHAADAWRYLAVGHKVSIAARAATPTRRVITLGSGATSWLGA